MSRVRFENRARAMPGPTKKAPGFATGAPHPSGGVKTGPAQSRLVAGEASAVPSPD